LPALSAFFAMVCFWVVTVQQASSEAKFIIHHLQKAARYDKNNI